MKVDPRKFILKLLSNNRDGSWLTPALVTRLVDRLPQSFFQKVGAEAEPSGYGLETIESLATQTGKMLDRAARRAAYVNRREVVDRNTGEITEELRSAIDGGLRSLQEEGVLFTPEATNAGISTGRRSTSSKVDWAAMKDDKWLGDVPREEMFTLDKYEGIPPSAKYDILTGKPFDQSRIQTMDDGERYLDLRASEYGPQGAGRVFLEPEGSPVRQELYETGEGLLPRQMDFTKDSRTGLYLPGEIYENAAGLKVRRVPRITIELDDVLEGTPAPGASLSRISAVAQNQPKKYQVKARKAQEEALFPDEVYENRRVVSPTYLLDPDNATTSLEDLSYTGARNLSNMARFNALVTYHKARQAAEQTITAADGPLRGQRLPANVKNALVDYVAKQTVINSIRKQGEVRPKITEALANRAYKLLMDNNIPLTKESMERAAGLVQRAFAEVSPQSNLKSNIENFLEVEEKLIKNLTFSPRELYNLSPGGNFVSSKPRQMNKNKALKTLRSAIANIQSDASGTISEGTKVSQLANTLRTGGAVATPDTADIRIAGLVNQMPDIDASDAEIALAVSVANENMIQAAFNDPFLYKFMIEAANQGYSEPVIVNAVSKFMNMNLAGRPGIVQGAVGREFVPSVRIDAYGQGRVMADSKITKALSELVRLGRLSPEQAQAVRRGLETTSVPRGLETTEDLAQREALALAGGNI